VALSEAENRRLTEVGPGREMGALLRRYWHPVAAASQFDEQPVRAVRLFGEDLVLYRDQTGRYGLVANRCAHRRADLSYGYVEACGLRCSYHGWAFDHTGACVEQPYDQTVNPASHFREQASITAYPVTEKAGLLWAYLGPDPAPLVPDYEPFSWEGGFVQIVFAEVGCNWFQCQENSIDPVHFEWLHDNWFAALDGRPGFRSPTHLRLAFDEFDHGFVYRRIRADTDERNPLWTVGRVCLWPNALFTGDHFEWRVPIDDEHTLSVMWAFEKVPEDCQPYRQVRIPSWTGPTRDESGRWITSHVMNQDFMAWTGQGIIADRSEELLSPSDRGIVALRRRFLADLDTVAGGGEPKAILRDPARNVRIELPIIGRAQLAGPLDREAFDERRKRYAAAGFPDGYIFQAGQPERVRAEWCQAMGLADQAASNATS
jgi:5,5'-dehydrodivanillate O-demethylase